MKGTTPKPFRRTAVTAGAVAVVVAIAALAGPADAGTPATAQTAGTASATAQSVKVNPTTASLSIGITFGTALAGYTNNVSQAESRGIDLGIIGTTLAGEGCDGGEPTLPAEDQPQPLRADSRDPNASQLKTENEKYLPLISKAVRADATPFSESNTTTAGITATGAFLDLGTAVSKATTRLVNGTREAIATVDISGIKIAGVLELSGLHWESISRSGTIDQSTGTFTIGSLKVAGQALPTNDAYAALGTANTLLNPLGIVLTLPTTREAAGIRFIEPLKISVVPNQARDSVSGLLLGLVQPVREQLVDILLAQDCGNDTYITVADIALGSVTGAGSFSLELGGAQTKSNDLKTSSFLGSRLSTPTAGGLGTVGDTLDDFDDTSSLGDTPSVSDGNDSNTGNKTSRDAAPIASVTKGSRGGRMALVGLLGLVALAIVADRDRRLMRRAQRLIATEA